MGIVEGYEMHLYCDVESDPEGAEYPIIGHDDPQLIAGWTRADCLRQARKAGWVIGRSVRCPLHRHTKVSHEHP